MPVKGLILIAVFAIIIAAIYHDEIYEWLTSKIYDENYNNEDNSEEEKTE